MRLRAVRRLQEAFWPLDAIAKHLASLEPSAIQKIAEGAFLPKPPVAPTDASAETRSAPEASPSQRDRIVRRIVLSEDVVVEVREPMTSEANALVERIRSLVFSTSSTSSAPSSRRSR